MDTTALCGYSTEELQTCAVFWLLRPGSVRGFLEICTSNIPILVLRFVLLGALHCSDVSSSCSLVPFGTERGVFGKTLCQFNTEPALSVGLFMVRSLLCSFECTQLTEQLVGTTLYLDFKHSVCVKLESDTEIPHFIVLTGQLCAALVQL